MPDAFDQWQEWANKPLEDLCIPGELHSSYGA
jgi:hypothetical protein